MTRKWSLQRPKTGMQQGELLVKFRDGTADKGYPRYYHRKAHR